MTSIHATPEMLSGAQCYAVLQPETVREWVGGNVDPVTGQPLPPTSERIVPASVDLEEVECPACKGTGAQSSPLGRLGRSEGFVVIPPVCSLCDSKGTVTVLPLETEQWRRRTDSFPGSWSLWRSERPWGDVTERRWHPTHQALGVETLPVVEQWPRGRPCIWVSQPPWPREVQMWDGHTKNGYDGVHRAQNVTDELWAKELTLGGMYVRWREVRPL